MGQHRSGGAPATPDASGGPSIFVDFGLGRALGTWCCISMQPS